MIYHNDKDKNIKDLCNAFMLLENSNEVLNFLKDLCTPNELSALAERWLICQYLNKGLSYREINEATGASLTTIGRVYRFLKNESYGGYVEMLKKLAKNKKED